jgi:hypothetical protein
MAGSTLADEGNHLAGKLLSVKAANSHYRVWRHVGCSSDGLYMQLEKSREYFVFHHRTSSQMEGK